VVTLKVAEKALAAPVLLLAPCSLQRLVFYFWQSYEVSRPVTLYRLQVSFLGEVVDPVVEHVDAVRKHACL
jgi:hypothetical protein